MYFVSGYDDIVIFMEGHDCDVYLDTAHMCLYDEPERAELPEKYTVLKIPNVNKTLIMQKYLDGIKYNRDNKEFRLLNKDCHKENLSKAEYDRLLKEFYNYVDDGGIALAEWGDFERNYLKQHVIMWCRENNIFLKSGTNNKLEL